MRVSVRICRRHKKALLPWLITSSVFIIATGIWWWPQGTYIVDEYEYDEEYSLRRRPWEEPHDDKLETKLSINVTESDLISQTPTHLNLDKYRKLLQWKISELKRNGVWKSIEPRETCNWNEAGGPCLDKNCKKPLPDVLSDKNLASALKPLTRLKSTAFSKVMATFGSIPRGSHITFLSATSSSHFMETQALLKNLHEIAFTRLTNYTFYFYDIGLKDGERKQLKKWCRCEIRMYPFDSLPERFRFLKGFTWKTFIINAHLPTTDFVVWVDSSIRFRYPRLEGMFEAARLRGLSYGSAGMFNIAEHTAKAMFDYYGDDACQYAEYSHGSAGFQVIHSDPFMREFFFKTWAACALDPLCMCSDFNLKQFHCNQGIRKYSKCHRADQSAHAMLLVKLFRKNIESFYLKVGRYHNIRRHDTANYFEELEANAT